VRSAISSGSMARMARTVDHAEHEFCSFAMHQCSETRLKDVKLASCFRCFAEENAWPAAGNSQQSAPILYKHTMYQCRHENTEEAGGESLAEVDEMNVSRMKEADDSDNNWRCLYNQLVAHNGG
jgi:hypothetical protein